MHRIEVIRLAESIISGGTPTVDQYHALLDVPDRDAFSLVAGADMIRDHFFGREVHLCSICNGKSGRCSENCSFCSQSTHSRTDAPVYPLLPKEQLKQGGEFAAQNPINRYSVVTTGKRLPPSEVELVAEALSELDLTRVGTCASLGTLGAADFRRLKATGVTRYHHNLETAESHFRSICTTHTYQDRIDTIEAARAEGLSVCSGGIFGIGETSAQVLELAFTLKELDVDAVPLNFLIPVKGTPLQNQKRLTPLRCLKIIAIFRCILPDKDIFVCGGREANLAALHPLVFHAGATGIMTGDYLTAAGRALQADLEMIDSLEFTVRKKNPH